MSVRRFLTSLGLVLLAAACAESPSAPTVAERTPNFLRWGGAAQPQLVFEGADSVGTRLSLSGGSDVTVSGLYQAQFWAVRGQSRTLKINYATNGDSSPFLRLTVSDPVYVPGRGTIAVGDSALITATVDPNVLLVKLEPHGLTFGQRTRLRMWYGAAGGDLNGDGVVNGQDAYIEQQLLGMWYQGSPDGPWSQIPANKSLDEKSLTSELEHFSGYSVAW